MKALAGRAYGIAGLSLALGSQASYAQGVPFPRIDPEPYCRTARDDPDGKPFGGYDKCMDRQQESLDRTKAIWAQLPPSRQEMCAKSFSRSYLGLEFCAHLDQGPQLSSPPKRELRY